MPKAVSPDSHPLDTMLAVSDVIGNRRLARIYTRVIDLDSPTVEEIATGLDSSTTTVYEDVNRLTDVGLLARVTGTQPHRYQANRIAVTIEIDDNASEITPTLIVSLARSDTNDNIGLYVDRHGIAGLATAVDYARDYVRGHMTARIMAREQDITVLEAETILQELREVLRDVEPEVTDDLDLAELDATVDELSQE